jgi:CheY-like chemotaxis protein
MANKINMNPGILRHANTRTGAGVTWERSQFSIALIGPESVRHAAAIEKAGFQIATALSGQDAPALFAQPKSYDAIVLDFNIRDRPPEAILIFARRNSPNSPFVALVPPLDDESYRRAFLAGARDVLPTPTEQSDLVSAIDYTLEPRALTELVQQLQLAQDFDGMPHQTSGEEEPSNLGEGKREAEQEIEVLRRQLESLGNTEQLNARAAIRDRDRALLQQEKAERRALECEDMVSEYSVKNHQLESTHESLRRDIQIAHERLRLMESRFRDAVTHGRALETRLIEKSNPNLQPPSASENHSAADAMQSPGSETSNNNNHCSEVNFPDLEGLWGKYEDSLNHVHMIEKELAMQSTLETVPTRQPVSGSSPLEKSVTTIKISALNKALADSERYEAKVAELADQFEVQTTGESVFADSLALSKEASASHWGYVKLNHAKALARERQLNNENIELAERLTEAHVEISELRNREKQLSNFKAELDSLTREHQTEAQSHQITRARLAEVLKNQSQLTNERNVAQGKEANEQARIEKAMHERDLEAEHFKYHLQAAEEENGIWENKNQVLEAEIEGLRLTIAALKRDREKQKPRPVTFVAQGPKISQ